MDIVTHKKRVSLRDIAVRSGVSIATASRALSNHGSVHDETRSRVVAVSEELGYAPPPDKSNSHHDNGSQTVANDVIRVGLVSVEGKAPSFAESDFKRWKIVKDLSDIAIDCNIRIEALGLDYDAPIEDIKRRIEWFSEGVDTFIFVGILQHNILSVLEHFEKPFVVWGGISSATSIEVCKLQHHFHIVSEDYQLSGRVATEALINEGHKRIGFIAGYFEPGLFFDQWRFGYIQAHYHAGLPVDNSLIYAIGSVKDVLCDTKGATAAKPFLDMADPPTAYVIPPGSFVTFFLEAMKDSPIKLDESNVIVGEIGENDESYLKNYRRIGHHILSLEKALKVAIQQFKKPEPHGLSISIPLTLINF